ncbi:MAG: hypothetical protein FWE34_07150 [Defluviitaleaceae bacterium]|nr:hypothetical protein [Defluviitaleaceae bacterium]
MNTKMKFTDFDIQPTLKEIEKVLFGEGLDFRDIASYQIIAKEDNIMIIFFNMSQEDEIPIEAGAIIEIISQGNVKISPAYLHGGEIKKSNSFAEAFKLNDSDISEVL